MKIQNEEERKMGLEDKQKRESKRAKIENDICDDWVWNFDMDKVINAYHAFVKKTKVWRHVSHNNKRQAKAKVKCPITIKHNFKKALILI